MNDPATAATTPTSLVRRHPRRRIRVAEGVYQRCDAKTGRPQPHKYEFTFRDGTGRQVWQMAAGTTKADAKAERAHVMARKRLGERLERTNLTVGDAARQWVERGIGARGPWDPSTAARYDRIVRRTITVSPDPGRAPLGRVRLRDLTVDQVAAWSKTNQACLAPTTASLALIALNQTCRYALRRGWLADNPVARLEGGEKPRWTPQPVRALEPAELTRLLDHAGTYRILFEMLALTGLRIGEALGLRWSDIDPAAGVLHVRRQLSRNRQPKRTKTDAGKRTVILAPAVTTILGRHRSESGDVDPDGYVFTTSVGTPLDYRKVGTHFRTAARRAGLTGAGRLSLHSLRHGYASTLIANGLNVVFVSRQLGHANPSITLTVYAHLFAQADHAAAARAALQATHAAITSPIER